MDRKSMRRLKTWLLLCAVVFGITAYYRSLDESGKRYLRNVVRQARYLPGRYVV
jgi:hypothetical protein